MESIKGSELKLKFTPVQPSGMVYNRPCAGLSAEMNFTFAAYLSKERHLGPDPNPLKSTEKQPLTSVGIGSGPQWLEPGAWLLSWL